MKYHEPVLLHEVLSYFQPLDGKVIVDCTLGDGGHTIAFLRDGAKVLGIDVSEKSLSRATERIKSVGLSRNFVAYRGNFRDIDKIITEVGFESVYGILFDLGYSSYQLDDASLGLSFKSDVPLDMRIDTSLGVTAADLLNTLPEKEITGMLREYSDERYARSFAKSIVKFRSLKKFQTTKDLADLLQSVASLGYEKGRIHPATRTFQTLRIVVNDEFTNLKTALSKAARILLPGGRVGIISFHSTEDRLVKQSCQNVQPSLKLLTKKPVTPSESEVAENIRARSAKLRIYERI